MIILSSCEKAIDSGDIIVKFYGDAYEDIGYSVVKADNGYVITGQLTEISRNPGNYINGSEKKLGVIKTDSDGNIVWQKILGDKVSASGSKVIYDDGHIICVGYSFDSVTLQKDIYVAMMDADGNGLVQKIFKSEGNQYGTDIIKTPAGFLILGTTDVEQGSGESTGNAPGKKDILLLTINDNLDQLLPPVGKGFPGNDEGIAIRQERNGGYIVVGTTDRSDNSENGQAGDNICLFRVNVDGSTTQIRIIGNAEDESAADIEVLDDGYLVAGTIGKEGFDQRGYVWKIPSDIYDEPVSAHEILISKAASDKPSFSLKAICRYKTNSFLMAGQYREASSSRMLIFATDIDGNMINGKILVEGGTGNQVAFDVICDDENIIAVGKNSYENNSMISLLKFRF